MIRQTLRMKPPARPVRMAPGKLWIGGPMLHLGHEVADASGLIWLVASLLDGTRSLEEVKIIVARDFGNGYDISVDAIVDLFFERGWLECTDAAKATLTQDQMEIFSRNVDYLRWVDRTPRDHMWSGQEMLLEKTVAVLGVGGVGSAAAQSLAGMGIGKLILIDGDRIERSNLNRQFLYRAADVGHLKAETAARRLPETSPYVKAEWHAAFPDNKRDIRALIEKADLLIHSADRPRDLILASSDAVFELDIPLISCGYAGPILSATMVVPGETPCYRCVSATVQGDFRSTGRGALLDNEKIPGLNPVVGPSAQIAGHFAAMAALNFFVRHRSYIEGVMFHQSFIDPTNIYSFKGDYRPECEVCGALNA